MRVGHSMVIQAEPMQALAYHRAKPRSVKGLDTVGRYVRNISRSLPLSVAPRGGIEGSLPRPHGRAG